MASSPVGRPQVAMTRLRHKIVVEGIVQGVGFRPFVYQLAVRLGLSGSVCNDTRGVTIEVEGEAGALHDFSAALRDEKPPLATIQSVDVQTVPARSGTGFSILPSVRDDSRRAHIAPDTFVCDECLAELFDPADRRYRYPFINCTNCGPRYTIVTGIPYDRPLTTMGAFPLCADCRTEYDDPASRRFHAQPNACPACGPQLAMTDADGRVLDCDDPVAEAVRRLARGQIVAIKGLGGYHLAVDAANQDAVSQLRRRKQRDEKPFALMARNLAAVQRLAVAGPDEARLLESVERPIVLLGQHPEHGLADNIAPGNRCFGLMLPYTPLHHLLLEQGFRALVMTSANQSDEPIAHEDREARARLAQIADVFLSHNRRIHARTDDSIARVLADRPLLLRRSRGYVPRAVALPVAGPDILAVGAELKNTICLTRGDRAFLSQHIGDLKNLEVYDSFKATVGHLRSILQINPQWVAHDLHPDYYSTRYATDDSDLPAVAVQHHHAHMSSCLAEHGMEQAAIGLIFDGIGYGADGHIWGGEFLAGDLRAYQRLGHFKYQPMPGADLATREPWRMALSYLLSIYGEIPDGLDVFTGLADHELSLVSQALAKGVNTPLTSSCGRLFDAVAAILGLRKKVSFEGQAAMELEMHADPDQTKAYPCRLSLQDGQLIYDPAETLESLVDDHLSGVSSARIAGRFHASLAAMIEEVCHEMRRTTGLDRVVLSGGVFQNGLLTGLAVSRLERSGFEVLTHALVPPNDGGVALGQAVVAAAQNRGLRS